MRERLAEWLEICAIVGVVCAAWIYLVSLL